MSNDNEEKENEDRLHEEDMERLMMEQERQQEEEALLAEQEPDVPVDAPPEEVQQQQQTVRRRGTISYTRTSFGAAIAVIWYALRTRQQWFLAMVYLSSSKWAYVVLGNAAIAFCVSAFHGITKTFIHGLRATEAEGLTDFFRWNVTETCLALTMFRSQITVKTLMLFLLLVLAKCLHWIVETRRGHFSMTEEAVVPNPSQSSWPAIQSQFVGIFFFLQFLLVADVIAIAQCAHDIAKNGPTVSVFFGFESAILFVAAMSNVLLAIMHFIDGLVHWSHEHSLPGTRYHTLAHSALHAWKDHKATFTFAIEVQAQAAKFMFYIIFFGIVLTYYGMPINLFREVYMSFQQLRQRLLAFAKYRRLMQSMNRFDSVESEEELEEAGKVCIICRDAMTLTDCKKLPGCNHVFHKSCLREWLIHQQTCPTCRGDIAATEARVRRAAADAAAQQQAQEGEDQQQGEAEQAEPHREGNAVAEPEQQQAPEASAPPAPASAAAAAGDSKVIQRSPICIPPPLAARSGCSSADAAFPCLYKVSSSDGAIVWIEVDNIWKSTRTIPKETFILCISLEWTRSENWSGMMLKIPDGYVREEAVERLSIQLPLKQSRQQRKQTRVTAEA